MGYATLIGNALEKFSDFDQCDVKIGDSKKSLNEIREKNNVHQGKTIAPIDQVEGALGFFQFIDAMKRKANENTEINNGEIKRSKKIMMVQSNDTSLASKNI